MSKKTVSLIGKVIYPYCDIKQRKGQKALESRVTEKQLHAY
jgi:hypothetical protein